MSERDQPERGQLWQHFKGTIYQIVEVGIWVGKWGNGAEVVAYRRIGPRSDPDFKTYFRSLQEFLSEKPVDADPRYVQKYRFERVECDR